MFNTDCDNIKISELLSEKGYWPARAAKYVDEGKYSKAVELCKENIKSSNKLLSVSLIYGQALYYAGQTETATEQFYHVLTLEPDNVVALKFLGDIKFAAGDDIASMAYYKKILELDSDSAILFSRLDKTHKETTHIITLKKGAEVIEEERDYKSSRKIPFYTETIGDMYLAQGYPKLAYEVFKTLNNTDSNSRLSEKLLKAKEKIEEKEKSYVKKTD